jgi:anti-sigma regulatory factor (Ser/Thr protein kinase)
MSRTRSFDHAPESVTAARRFATETVRGVAQDALDAVALMVSELATNCIKHTAAGFDLTIIQSSDGIRVEATDRGAGEPTVRSPQPTEPTGRGLQIIDMLSDQWGYERRPGSGKTVWFTLAAPAAAATCSG